MAIEFSNEIRAGDLLVVLGFVATGLTAFMNIKNRINILDLKMTYIDAQVEDLKVSNKDSALLEERITALRRRVDELSHWKGFVNPDGEWTRDGHRPHRRDKDDSD